ncbi:hypothetical protein Sru01_16430 [Sphaerisporangium rufum]|uniref:Minimal CRISPR polymerase domain-containing protein n=1 Tax=Sphaerisporangium rufum TaxID=1381558 RepID=A0A919UX50_9ACTN|nr:mCpol domain-containing protein [Sphaerisporangium rufum]GII76661.1 hypothetical protein Sru01_16430 [Sphaerisporangium rufum]
MVDKWFLALDGDDIGRHLELRMLTENVDGLRAFASAFGVVLDKIYRDIEDCSSVVALLRGGDSLLLELSKAEISSVIRIIRNATDGTDFTFSGGYGRTLRDAYFALKLAKASGKDRVIAADSGEL